MNKSKAVKISKEEFLKLNEKDVMFITNPGRMGDEDGITFVVKQNNQFIIYRVDGWMYHRNGLNEESYISLEEASKQFPEWYQTWKKEDKNEEGKYKYFYMGFGNGLCVDYSIDSEYEPYLNKRVEEYLESHKEEKEDLQYIAIYKVWEEAFIEMMQNKNE